MSLHGDDYKKAAGEIETGTLSWIKDHQKASWSILAVICVFCLGFCVGKAHSADLTVTMPAGCVPVLNGTVVSCQGVTPPPVCTPPQTGTYPNCGTCPSGGTYPNCTQPPPGNCPGFANTILVQQNWANPQTMLSGGFGPNDIFIVQFTTGPNVGLSYGNINAAEYQSQPSTRVATLSTKACDFTPSLGAGSTSTSNTVTVNFTVGPNGSGGYYPALLPNTTYFWNVKNLPNSTCGSSGVCNVFSQMHKPQGT